MIKAALIGYGKMGRALERLAPSQGIEITACLSSTDSWDQKGVEDAEVCIEFTRPDQVVKNTERALSLCKPLVIGTTGVSEDVLRTLVHTAGGAAIYAPNFSIGIHLFKKIVAYTAGLLQGIDLYDLSLSEIHHKEKKDSPSGTALSLAHLLESCGYDQASERINSQRCGFVPGTHSLLLDSAQDSIRLTHEARSREGFALGALQAARWIVGKQGFYTLDDILK